MSYRQHTLVRTTQTTRPHRTPVDPCAGHGPYGGNGPSCGRCGYPAGRRVIELPAT